MKQYKNISNFVYHEKTQLNEIEQKFFLTSRINIITIILKHVRKHECGMVHI